MSNTANLDRTTELDAEVSARFMNASRVVRVIGISIGSVFVLILLLIAGIYALGLSYPKEHRAVVQVRLAAPPEQVWAVLHDYGSYPEWCPGVGKMTRQPDKDGHIVWKEEFPESHRLYEFTVDEPPHRLVAKVTDSEQTFGGQWTMELEQLPTGSALTLTEDGEVYNPFFRVIFRKYVGVESTIKGFAEMLVDHLNEQATVTVVEAR